MLFELVFATLFWLGLAIVVGVAGDTRGRNGFGWFILAIVISPLLAGLLLIALPRLENRSAMADAPMKKCPYCAQMIPAEALVCHLCRREVDTPENVKVLLGNENKRSQQKSLRKQRIEAITAFMIIMIILIIINAVLARYS